MDQELNRRITEALRRACEPDPKPEIRLEESGTNHVGGEVVSTRFAGLTPSARQDLIWQQLDDALDARERTLISFILAETREEYDALTESRAQGA